MAKPPFLSNLDTFDVRPAIKIFFIPEQLAFNRVFKDGANKLLIFQLKCPST